MYWNIHCDLEPDEFKGDKLQHEMYWNLSTVSISGIFSMDKLQHEMYWNIVIVSSNPSIGTINYNMRCIETYIPCVLWNYIPDKLQHEMYWNATSETLKGKIIPDKLQHEMYWNYIVISGSYPAIKINYNMRCIETGINKRGFIYADTINYNMRCIETQLLIILNCC